MRGSVIHVTESYPTGRAAWAVAPARCPSGKITCASRGPHAHLSDRDPPDPPGSELGPNHPGLPHLPPESTAGEC